MALTDVIEFQLRPLLAQLEHSALTSAPAVVQALVLLMLLGICSLGPGLFVVRKLRWSPLEKFSGAIALSLFILYVAYFSVFVLDLRRAAFWLISLICLALFIASWRDALQLWRSRAVRRTIVCFLLLMGWGLIGLSLTRHYSGGVWAGDWLEHYERSLFFLEHYPLNYRFLQIYALPARPPLMNVLASGMLGQVGPQFYLFQITFLFLNTLPFVPCAMLAAWMRPRGRRAIWVMMVLFALNPAFIHNSTFTWTKLFTAFYVLLGLWFYLRGWHKPDATRLPAAFASLATALLVHFSAGPYVTVLTLHYLFYVLWLQPRRWQQLAMIMFLSAAILSTWLVWSVHHYGLKQTLAANSAVQDAQPLGLEANLRKIASNIYWTLLPHPITRDNNIARDLDQLSVLGYLRDYTFCIYQHNLFFGMGTAAAIAAPWLSVKNWQGLRSLSMRLFLAVFVPGITLLGIAVVGTPDSLGLAHICLQPLMLMGATLLAVNLSRLGINWRVWTLLGVSFDFVLGILLHFRIQHHVFRLVRQHDGWGLESNELTFFAANSWAEKQLRDLEFLGDLTLAMASALQTASIACFLVLLWILWQKSQPQAVTVRAPDSSRRKAPKRSRSH